ncbi:glycoside hydrolase family 95-like protein [Streptomyces sp. NPDC047917]|uniref:glycoside hydrolase family 95-like protein n=1 Tax=Streptomyces sp. NPDC047917 TaxID=3365491 RepID=UPI003713589E
MLAQSRPGNVELLPALPKGWAADDSVTGVGLRGGLGLGMSWKSGKVTSATVRSAADRSTTTVHGDWSRQTRSPPPGR